MTKCKLTLKSILLQLLMIATLPISINRSPSPPPQLFQLKKAKVKYLKAFLMAKVKPTSGNKYALLVNVK